MEDNDYYLTPRSLLQDIRQEFGEFFDPCPRLPEFDGLNIDWNKVNFVNPPYSRHLKESFIKKAYEEQKKGNTSILLLPVRTSSKVFHDIVLPNAELRFFRGRITFINPRDHGKPAPAIFDSMLVIFRGKIVKKAE